MGSCLGLPGRRLHAWRMDRLLRFVLESLKDAGPAEGPPARVSPGRSLTTTALATFVAVTNTSATVTADPQRNNGRFRRNP